MFCLYFFTLWTIASASVNITIGVILPFSYPDPTWQTIFAAGLEAARLALYDAQAEGWLSTADISLRVVDSYSSNDHGAGAGSSIIGTIGLIQEGIVALIGDGTSGQCTQNGLLTSRFEIPQCSFSAGSAVLSDKVNYPYFFRTISGPSGSITAFIQVCKYYNWQIVAVVYTGDSLGSSFNAPTVQGLNAAGITVAAVAEIPNGQNILGSDGLIQAVNTVKASNAKIIILIGDVYGTAAFMATGYQYGIVGDNNAYLLMNSVNEELAAMTTNSTVVADIVKGSIVVSSMIGDSSLPYVQSFQTKWENLPYPEYTFQNISISLNVPNAYGCMISIMAGFHMIATQMGNETDFLLQLKAGNISNLLNYTAFNTGLDGGPIGALNYDHNGDFVGPFGLYVYVDENDPLANSAQVVINADGTFNVQSPVIFHDGSTNPPSDRPFSATINTPYGSGVSIIFIFISAAMILICLAFLGFIYINRNLKTVKNISPISSMLMIIGFIIAYTTSFITQGIPTNVTCGLQVWLPTIAFSMAFSNLLTKTWRIYKIYSNVRAMSLAIKNQFILSVSLGVTIVNVAILLVWWIRDPMLPKRFDIDAFSHVYLCTSASQNFQSTMTGILYAYNGTFLIFGTFLAYKTRGVASAFNESKYISMAIYNIFASIVIIIPLLFVKTIYFQLFFTLRQLLITFSSTFTFAVLFLPVLFRVVEQKNATNMGGSETVKSNNNGEVSMIPNLKKKADYNIIGHQFKLPYMLITTSMFSRIMGNWQQGMLYVIDYNCALLVNTNTRQMYSIDIQKIVTKKIEGNIVCVLCPEHEIRFQAPDENILAFIFEILKRVNANPNSMQSAIKLSKPNE